MLSILLLIAGLCVYFVTEYDTLGVIIAIIGGVLVAIQLLFFVLVAVGIAGSRHRF